MVRIRFELLPAGGGEPRLLQELLITNTGTGDKVHGNYDAVLSHASGFRAGAAPAGFEDPHRPQAREIWKRVSVVGWRRDRSAAELAFAVLSRCFRRSP